MQILKIHGDNAIYLGYGGMMEVSEGGDYYETTWVDGEEQW